MRALLAPEGPGTENCLVQISPRRSLCKGHGQLHASWVLSASKCGCFGVLSAWSVREASLAWWLWGQGARNVG